MELVREIIVKLAPVDLPFAASRNEPDACDGLLAAAERLARGCQGCALTDAGSFALRGVRAAEILAQRLGFNCRFRHSNTSCS